MQGHPQPTLRIAGSPLPDLTTSARARIRFALVFIAHALGAMSVLSVLTAGPQLVMTLGLTPLQLGGLASVYSAALAAASFPAGLVVDRLGTRSALALAALVIASGLAIAAFARGYWYLGLGMAVCGSGYGLINPAAGRAITLWFTSKWRATLLSLKQTGVPAGAAIGSMTALLGPGEWGHVGIFCASMLALVAAGLFLVLLPAADRQDKPMDAGENRIRAIFALPNLGRANLAAGVTNGIQFALWAHVPTLLHHVFSNGAAVLALAVAALHAGTFLGRIVWGVLADRVLRGDAARALHLLCMAALLGVVALAGLTMFPQPALAVLGCFLMGFTVCAAVGLHVALTTQLAPSPLLGGALGYTMLLANLGGVCVPLLIGFALAAAGTVGIALVLAALLVLAVALLPAHAMHSRG